MSWQQAPWSRAQPQPGLSAPRAAEGRRRRWEPAWHRRARRQRQRARVTIALGKAAKMLVAHHAAPLRAVDSRQTDWWSGSWPGSESEGGWQWRTVEEQQVIIAKLQEQVDMLTCANEKILDEYRRRVRDLSRRPAAEVVDELRSEIGELKGVLIIHGPRREGHRDWQHYRSEAADHRRAPAAGPRAFAAASG